MGKPALDRVGLPSILLRWERVSERLLIWKKRKKEKKRRSKRVPTNGEMIDKIQEWINADGDLLSDEEVIENIRELVNGGGI